MGVFDGMGRKFTVIKNADIEKHLDERDRSELSRILWKIDELRYQEDKPVNVYLVVNIDEPYAPELVEIMKQHGHWGTSDPNQLEMIIEDEVFVLPVFEMGD